MSGLQHVEAQMIMARPWDAAEEESIWDISGSYPNGKGVFTNCLAVALPHYATDGHIVFKMIGALDDLISPAWITRATLLILVRADSPRHAYYEADQDYLGATDD
jgi:hypothetical protein